MFTPSYTPTWLYHSAQTIAAAAFLAVARCQLRTALYRRVTLTAAAGKRSHLTRRPFSADVRS